MKKILLMLFAVVCTTNILFAQKGNNQLGIAFETGFPLGDFNDFQTGFGGSAKLMLGVGNHAQITFTSGYTSFKWKESNDELKIKEDVIPILAGYRYNFTVLYLEPRLGVSIYDTKAKSDVADTKSESSEAGFTLGLQAGVQISNLDLNVKYQAGYPNGGTVGFFGIGVGYNFALKQPHH